MIQIRINDPRSLGSWRIKGTVESTLGKDFSVPLMRHDLSDLGITDPDLDHAKGTHPLSHEKKILNTVKPPYATKFSSQITTDATSRKRKRPLFELNF